MKWDAYRGTWPHAEFSKFIQTTNHKWHVQVMGDGPVLFFLHGAGASTHTWRHVTKFLSDEFKTVAVDLPGQGFTKVGAPRRYGLETTARDLLELVEHLDLSISTIVGHSAGAAIALEMVSKANLEARLVLVNGALQNFQGTAGWAFPAIARLLSATPFASFVFSSLGASKERAKKIIESTGSQISEEGVELYQALFSDQKHLDATLSMMAQWDLGKLLPKLPQIGSEALLLAGQMDSAVPVSVSEMLENEMPSAKLKLFPSSGHLLQEEEPLEVSENIRDFAKR